jgi:hypothetical protein
MIPSDLTDEEIRKTLREMYVGATEAEIERYLLKAKRDGCAAIKQWGEKKRIGEIKGRLIKIFPTKTPEEIEELKRRALADPEWYKGLEKASKVKNRLRAEYQSRRDECRPSFSEEQLDKLSTQSNEEWFKGLGKRVDKDYLPRPDIEAPYVPYEAGGLPKKEEETGADYHYGAINDGDLAELVGPDEQLPKRDLEREARMLELCIELFLSTRSDDLRHMRASVALELFRGTLSREAKEEIAKHFDKSPERVNQVTKEVKNLCQKGLGEKELSPPKAGEVLKPSQ